MRKILILLAFVLTGCGCVYPQIPPQFLYMDKTCGAALPDYLPKIIVADNCGVKSVEQTPSAGSWLIVPTTTVLIRATDNFNNRTDLMFTVTLIDTVPPVITLGDSTLISDNYSKINAVYDIADRMLARQEMWFDSVLPDSIPVYDDYANDVLITWTSPALAFTGVGGRWHTFGEPGDTLILR